MRILPWVMLVVLAACQAGGPAPMSDAERAQIVQAIEEQADAFMAAANSRDTTPLVALVTEDVEVVDFASHYVGVDAYLEGTQGLFDNFQTWTSEWDQRNIEVLSSDAAVLEGQFTLRRQHTDGRWQESSPYIYMTAIFRLIGDDWKMTRGQLSGSLRAVETTD